MIFNPGDAVTDAETRTLRGVVVDPGPFITMHNVGRGNVLVKWDHLERSQPEHIGLLELTR